MSIENVCTWPSRKLASALPVKLDSAEPIVGTACEFVNRVLKLKFPVGEGGWITSSLDQRKSRPAFNEWRPNCHEVTSKTCVTSVRKSEAVLAEGPSCWRPAIENVGNVF